MSAADGGASSRGRRGSAWGAAALSLLASLALVEVVLRVAHPLPDPSRMAKFQADAPWPGGPYVPSAFPPHYTRRNRAEPGLPGVDRAVRRFTTNNLGFRGDSLAMPKPAGEVRVFMVGGSTTECAVLDDREAVTARLQAYLRRALPGVDVRVYNAGKSGDRSWDHVAMVAHRIAHLQPDVIVVFAGVNDVMAGIGGRDYLLRNQAEPPRTRRLLRLLATEFQLPRLAAAALHGGDPRTATGNTSYRAAVRYVHGLPLAAGKPREDVEPYAQNLRSLAGIARSHGAQILIMTQATTWNSPDPRIGAWHWMLGGAERYREADLDAAMARYNAAAMTVAAQEGAPTFDLAAAIPKSADDFYDDVHFNVRGADTAAALLARFMVERGVVAAKGR
jgi:lysophospholipase L1-like esterase